MNIRINQGIKGLAKIDLNDNNPKSPFSLRRKGKIACG